MLLRGISQDGVGVFFLLFDVADGYFSLIRSKWARVPDISSGKNQFIESMH